MIHTHLLASLSLTIALVSCASQKADMYDTSDTYGTPDAAIAQTAVPENPIYDTPAVYEESAAVTSAAPLATAPASMVPAAPSAPAASHTVVRGDTLSGISKKYNVPMDAIKRANNMTNDIVVLGRTMVIPAR